ncbi:putative ergosterol biosynthetic protein [Clavispora lusitaniae]|uniref:Ergosterol biosynthetic protein n=3 Tax=Clavispora lusitaniae TaxID=36911 RepID=C4YC32_CLAL4|nr:uncharacterized protein CLUG_05849 [Clavispora lusitaniae ATCC 42720]KAF5208682.1 ergosterol biosynthesis protein [Clavispora lusitaniae]EEQ41721.1 hypothetical protein CLUG_05849 [Clavispora lusitaniae ATCC 42720]KAF7580500.1 Ergosterol biosynthetic protein 28 domain protein [Clavispora lusitaniae]QFZ30374.1 putative ergosterol biosynthetic protein [Clavispora lusitaniae]QFZ36036.1 putative ergosterol biosynthetic protein [Clavispora lusitaniae]
MYLRDSPYFVKFAFLKYNHPTLHSKTMFPFSSLLPPTTPAGGFLPHWLLFISVVSVFNSCQTYMVKDLSLTRKVYSSAPQTEVTNLSARTFGTWTFLTSIVRFYGAYNLIGNETMYNLCIWTFVVAGVHFVSEWLWFKNCKLDKGLAGPLVVSSASLVWMFSQKEFYLGY